MLVALKIIMNLNEHEASRVYSVFGSEATTFVEKSRRRLRAHLSLDRSITNILSGHSVVGLAALESTAVTGAATATSRENRNR